jgi:hypothetical protein
METILRKREIDNSKLNNYQLISEIQVNKEKAKQQQRRKQYRNEVYKKCKNEAIAAFFYTALGTSATSALLANTHQPFLNSDLSNTSNVPTKTIDEKENEEIRIFFEKGDFKIKYGNKNDNLVDLINAGKIMMDISDMRLSLLEQNLNLNYNSSKNHQDLLEINEDIKQRVNLEGNLELRVILEINKIIQSRGNKLGRDYFKEIEEDFSKLTVFNYEMTKACKKHNVSKNLIYGLVATESQGEIFAYSDADAAGLWQLMPETARDLGLIVDEFIDQRYEPLLSADVAIGYFSKITRKLEFDINPILGLIAYNLGPTKTSRLVKKFGTKFEDLVGHIPLETERHVIKTLSRLYLIMYADELNLNIEQKPSYRKVIQKLETDYFLHRKKENETMKTIADKYDTTEFLVRLFNPQLTPDNIMKNHPIKVSRVKYLN